MPYCSSCGGFHADDAAFCPWCGHQIGPAGEVEQLVAWCRLGPPDAEVEDVDVVEEQTEGLRGFEIR